MRRETGRVELVGGARPEGGRDDKPQWIERCEADDDQERVLGEHADDAVAGGGPHCAIACLRTQSDSPIRTLAIPSSITATLAAVPSDPFEKLRQM